MDAIVNVKNDSMNCQINTNTSTDKKCDNVSNNGDYNNQINEDSFYKDNTTHYKKKNIKKLLAHDENNIEGKSEVEND